MDVLVAHATEEARRALCAGLAPMDLTVVETADGEKARAILSRDHGPQVALLDWDLPGVSGLDVCRHLREGASPRPLYLIVVAPAARGRDVTDAAGAGADGYLWTPVAGDELRARIAFARSVLETRPAPPAVSAQEKALRCYDPLTRTHDRAQAVERLDQELARSRRERVTLGVAILDVDGLQPVNLRHGRDAGDEVLREVGRRVKGALRPYDVVGRLQSDEFLIITPRTGELDVAEALDRVRRTMSAKAFVYGREKLSVTVTLGGVTGSEETAEELIEMARPVLSEAKRSGGDNVIAGAKVVLESVLTNQWSE
jgi:two-component system, cell cycle response regulator